MFSDFYPFGYAMFSDFTRSGTYKETNGKTNVFSIFTRLGIYFFLFLPVRVRKIKQHFYTSELNKAL